jgi:hypothetical protein
MASELEDRTYLWSIRPSSKGIYEVQACHTAVAVSATFDEPSRSVRSLFSQPTTIIFLLNGDTSDISKPMHAQLVDLINKRIWLKIRYAMFYGQEDFVTAWPSKQPDVGTTETF